MNDCIKEMSPGFQISFILENLNWSQEDLADVIGVNKKTVNYLINNKQPITPEIAILLENSIGQKAQYWLNLSNVYQLAQKKKKNISKEELISKKAQMRKYMPVAEMKKLNWFVNDISTLEGIQNEYERIFGTKDFPLEKYEDENLRMAARQTREDTEFTKNYRLTWYFYALMCSKKIKNENQFNRESLLKIAENLYTYTIMNDGEMKIISDLYDCGVNFFVLSHLQKTYLDGAAFVQDGKPFIVYTARYDRVDNFWFVLAHEIAHILFHFNYLNEPDFNDVDKKLENNSYEKFDAKEKREQEADENAQKFLNQETVLDLGREFNRYITEERLLNLSEQAGVGSSVALGMLQHAGLVQWRQFTKFREKVKEKIPNDYILG